MTKKMHIRTKSLIAVFTIVLLAGLWIRRENSDEALGLRSEPLPRIIERVFDATTAFELTGKPEDDLTLMLVRRH